MCADSAQWIDQFWNLLQVYCNRRLCVGMNKSLFVKLLYCYIQYVSASLLFIVMKITVCLFEAFIQRYADMLVSVERIRKIYFIHIKWSMKTTWWRVRKLLQTAQSVEVLVGAHNVTVVPISTNRLFMDSRAIHLRFAYLWSVRLNYSTISHCSQNTSANQLIVYLIMIPQQCLLIWRRRKGERGGPCIHVVCRMIGWDERRISIWSVPNSSWSLAIARCSYKNETLKYIIIMNSRAQLSERIITCGEWTAVERKCSIVVIVFPNGEVCYF